MQLINTPGVVTIPKSQSVLNLVLCNEPDIISDFQVEEVAVGLFSDHCPITFTITAAKPNFAPQLQKSYSIDVDKRDDWSRTFSK
jgi:hypothetical protein